VAWLASSGDAPAEDEVLAAPARPEAQRAEATLTVTVTKIVPVELQRTVTANGEIHAWQEVVIGPEIGGYRVAEVRVDVGDQVTSGQTLVELATPLLEAEVATKRATLEQREAELAQAETELRRAAGLSSRDLLAAADLDRLSSEARAAAARLESARADLETSTLRLSFARVTAPDDGVI